MKNIAIIISILILVIVLGLYLISFQVRETESALVMTFGDPTREITKPGLFFKWPTPIQRVYTFDSRMRVFETDLIETETDEQVPIIVNTFIVWRITEPLKFFKAIGTVREAENNKLLPLISDTQNTVIGRHYFGEFVNSDTEKIKFSQIEEEMLADLQQEVADANYGIDIMALGIKQLKISGDVTTQVFERMRADRNRIVQATIAEGNAEATRIKMNADSITVRVEKDSVFTVIAYATALENLTEFPDIRITELDETELIILDGDDSGATQGKESMITFEITGSR